MSRDSLYKDRIEVSLDGRQIFYLFFGGALVSCMVFVLGVFVGKKVEARSHIGAMSAQAHRDPLAALDQIEAAKQDTGRSALTAGGPAVEVPPVEREIAAIERTRKAVTGKAAGAESDNPTGLPVADALKATVPSDVAKPKAAGATEPDAPVTKPDKAADATKSGKNEGPSDRASELGAERPSKDKDSKTAKTELAKKSDKNDKPTEKNGKDDKKETVKNGKFTLQLSSFQKRSEAEDFADTVRDAGFPARIVEASVEGKGTFYRVRSGSFTSSDDAQAAKAALERKLDKTAIVTKM